MITQTVTDAKHLLEIDSTFKALISVWEEQKQCPLVMVDLLLEYGLNSQAEAARWAATEGLRPEWDYDYGPTRMSYPYPFHWKERHYDEWYWVAAYQNYSDCTPNGRLPPNAQYGSQCRIYPTLRNALVGLLDDWQVDA